MPHITQLVSAGICASVKDAAVCSGRRLGTELSYEGITVTSFQLHYPQSDIALSILHGKCGICAVFAKICLPLFHCNLPFCVLLMQANISNEARGGIDSL